MLFAGFWLWVEALNNLLSSILFHSTIEFKCCVVGRGKQYVFISLSGEVLLGLVLTTDIFQEALVGATYWLNVKRWF